MKKYIIVKANGLDQLEKFVNEAYRNGYVAVGGPLRIYKGECHDIWFAQAMVLA
jgi:hypothetical protein